MRAIAPISLALALALAACGGSPSVPQYGPEPTLPAQEAGLVPAMKIAKPAGWGDAVPVVPDGYSVTALATGLKIPRQLLVLPNGDILVSEGLGGNAPPLRPKDIIAGLIKGRAKTGTEGGNRITLLRDTNGDGRADVQSEFIKGLNAPYGLAYANGAIYVANQDALLRFDYAEGQTQLAGPGVKIADLPAHINHHWTKALAASPDGSKMYVGIGSNSNIAERGMPAEENRAMVWEIDAVTGAHRPYATGLRNPTALAFQPATGQLWTAVNERDELGANLVPDYITSVRPGGFYGWPYAYWGQNVDPRVMPRDPAKVAATIRPDYGLGSHVAALGLAFSSPVMGAPFAEGAFVGEHGSWNRRTFSGYRVIFVPFRNGRPAGQPVDFATGFLDGDKARGRPVGVAVDPRGALLVADDLSNTVWRIAPTNPVSVPAAPSSATPPPQG